MPRATLWSSEAPGLIADSIRHLRETQSNARIAAFAEATKAYVGGQACLDWLVRHVMERDERWAERRARFVYPAYYSLLADAYIDGVYGDAVSRELQGASKSQQELFDGIYAANMIDRAQREIGQAQVVCGEAWVNVRWIERKESVRIAPVYPGNIWFETYADDPRQIAKVIEECYLGVDDKGNPRAHYWIATEEWLWEVDQDGATITKKFDHGYKLAPYINYYAIPVVGYEGSLSPLRDQIAMQKTLLNRISEQETMLMYQAFSLLVVKDNQHAETQKLGPTAKLELSAEGDAFYLQPNAPLAEMREAVESHIGMMCETGATPRSLFKGGSANSGFQLEMEYLPHTRKVATLRTEARMAEEQLAKLVCAVGARHGLALPSDPKPRVVFADNVLPTDKDAEFLRDMRWFESEPPLMTTEELIRKWKPSVARDEATLKAHLEELKTEAEARKAAQPEPEPRIFGGVL